MAWRVHAIYNIHCCERERRLRIEQWVCAVAAEWEDWPAGWQFWLDHCLCGNLLMMCINVREHIFSYARGKKENQIGWLKPCARLCASETLSSNVFLSAFFFLLPFSFIYLSEILFFSICFLLKLAISNFPNFQSQQNWLQRTIKIDECNCILTD